MEFQVCGKLDENGRIVSMQSQCTGSDVSPLAVPPSQSSFVTEAGEKFVPYSTKKELNCKLDTKIDEMSLLMVQMGELTKRLKLQEKLIENYEDKDRRQTLELTKLRAENDELRSMINKRRRNSSFSSSFDDPSVTSPKTFDMQTDADITDDDIDNYLQLPKYVDDVDNSITVAKKQACDHVDKKIMPDLAEVEIPLPVDAHGYVLLSNASKSSNVSSEQNKNGVDGNEKDEEKTFLVETNFNVEFSCHTQSVHKIVPRAYENSGIGAERCTASDGIDTVDSPTVRRPDLTLEAGDYIEMSDGPVLPGDRYRTRPPMPLPTRSKSTASEPASPGTTSLNPFNRPPLTTRNSCPDIRAEVPDEKLRCLWQNMKTTMEWNEARKQLISKSNEWTAEKADEYMKSIVRRTYQKCLKRLVDTSSNGILAEKMMNFLKSKNLYDEDILTQSFLEKCIHLMRSL